MTIARDNPPKGSNTGHGHVFPRPDGVKARCGGPGLCSVCGADLARKIREGGTTTEQVMLPPDEVSFHPGEAIRHSMPYTEHRRRLIEYLLSKVALCDWHGVSDAANDLRELDALERGRAGK
jgi:hypothetical protein